MLKYVQSAYDGKWATFTSEPNRTPKITPHNLGSGLTNRNLASIGLLNPCHEVQETENQIIYEPIIHEPINVQVCSVQFPLFCANCFMLFHYPEWNWNDRL